LFPIAKLNSARQALRKISPTISNCADLDLGEKIPCAPNVTQILQRQSCLEVWRQISARLPALT